MGGVVGGVVGGAEGEVVGREREGEREEEREGREQEGTCNFHSWSLSTTLGATIHCSVYKNSVNVHTTCTCTFRCSCTCMRSAHARAYLFSLLQELLDELPRGHSLLQPALLLPAWERHQSAVT